MTGFPDTNGNVASRFITQVIVIGSLYSIVADSMMGFGRRTRRTPYPSRAERQFFQFLSEVRKLQF